MKCVAIAVLALSTTFALADDFANRPPVNGGGVYRASQLWIDPAGNNDLDGDAICYTDFILANPSTIDHIEWWGDLDPNLGFQIEFWRQDPGTIAYQPLGVFRQAGAQPEASFLTSGYTTTSDPSGSLHFSLDLPDPVTLAANDASNVRWFTAIIGRTSVPYQQWRWAQDSTFVGHTFQWVRGGNEGGGDLYRSMGDGRALILAGTAVPEPASWAILGMGLAWVAHRRKSTR